MFTGHNRWGVEVTPRLVLGVTIALVGVVLLLDRLGLVDAGFVLRLWPIGIFGAGAVIYAQAQNRGGSVNGGILMFVGAWLLLNSLGITRVGFWDLFWPLVLITIGTMLIRQNTRRSAANPLGGADRITVFAVLSGVKRMSNSTRFRGGDVTAFMGGGQIDLRQAIIPPGEEAVIDVLAVMGGCEIVAPPTWNISTPIVPIMGGVEDKRLPPLPGATDASLPAPRLVIRGLVLMGGLEIKS
jgi:predicted membrane protein